MGRAFTELERSKVRDTYKDFKQPRGAKQVVKQKWQAYSNLPPKNASASVSQASHQAVVIPRHSSGRTER